MRLAVLALTLLPLAAMAQGQPHVPAPFAIAPLVALEEASRFIMAGQIPRAQEALDRASRSLGVTEARNMGMRAELAESARLRLADSRAALSQMRDGDAVATLRGLAAELRGQRHY